MKINSQFNLKIKSTGRSVAIFANHQLVHNVVLDTNFQICFILDSFSGKDIILSWKDNPVSGSSKDVSLHTYYLRETTAKVRVTHYPALNGECTANSFALRRHIAFRFDI